MWERPLLQTVLGQVFERSVIIPAHRRFCDYMKQAEAYASILKDLANTMLGVSRESVALMKRSDQQQAMQWNRAQEWDVYLEFLRMLFNVVDRLSAFHIPIQDQPEFMNGLEDSVARELKVVLAPTLSSSEIDDMEVTMSVGNAVSESRRTYERFRFMITEQSKQRDEYFQFFAERVADKAGAPGKQELTAAAFLCGNAVVPAFERLFTDTFKKEADTEPASDSQSRSESVHQSTTTSTTKTEGPQTIKLVSVLSTISGEEVDTRWGVHPRFQSDLEPNEAKELAKHMNRVTRIVGERFAVVASLAQSGEDKQQQVGHA